VIIADVTAWQGIPVAAWPAAQPGISPAAQAQMRTPADTAPGAPTVGYVRPRGRGIPAIPEDIPLACWLPIKLGLTPHGLRHKTWMAENGIPEILAEQRLGHQVPGIRGLYAHASDRMLDELKAALQPRWEESLRARTAIGPRSPAPLLDELLAPHREATRQAAQPTAPRATQRQPPTPVDREKMISQIPPKRPEAVTTAVGWNLSYELLTWPDTRNDCVELRGLEPLTPCLQKTPGWFGMVRGVVFHGPRDRHRSA